MKKRPGERKLKRERALELLARGKPELQTRFGVTRLALFGSTARDAAASGSDADILVAFDDGHQWNVGPSLLRLIQSAGDVTWP